MKTPTHFFTYALLDTSKPGSFIYGKYKFDHEPFYVGKGKGERHRSHLSFKGEGNNLFKNNKISKLRRSGFEPIAVKILVGMSVHVALLHERILIRVIGRRNFKKGPLTNLTDGGDGVTNLDPKVAKKRAKHAKATMLNKSAKEKEDIRVKRLITLNSRSADKKKESSRKVSETMRNKPKNEKLKRSRKISKTLKSRTPEQKLLTSTLRTITCKNRTKEEQEIVSKIHSDKMKNRTEEEIAATNKKHAETLKNRPKQLEDQRREKIRTAASNRSPEQKRLIQEKRRATIARKRDEQIFFHVL